MESDIAQRDFRLVGSSAIIFSSFEQSCGVIPDDLDAELFLGGMVEGNVCFEIPESETDLILFYDPFFGSAERRWMRMPEI